MDDFLKKTIDGPKNEPNFEEKKIDFKVLKEKRGFRTYVLHLDKYIKDSAELEIITRNIKKSLGTSCVLRDADFVFGCVYGFGGDCPLKIKKYLIEKGHVTPDSFKK